MAATPAPLSVTECLSDGWRAFQRDPVLGSCTWLVFFIVGPVEAIPFVGWLIGFLFNGAVCGGSARLAMRIVESKSPRLEDLFVPFRTWWRYLLPQVLLFLMAAVLLCPFLVPLALAPWGIHEDPSPLVIILSACLFLVAFPFMMLIGIRFGMWGYLLADSPRVGALASLSRSWEITSGSFLRLVGLSLLCGLIQVVGVACLVVGLLVTIPVALLAFAAAYVRLRPADLIEAMPATPLPPPAVSPASPTPS
jgi:uncharacterized membrane protein